MRGLQISGIGNSRNDFSGHPYSFDNLVSRYVVGDYAKEWCKRDWLQRVLVLKSYETAWTWLHKFRRAMVRPGRELLNGRVEVDECYIGAPENELRGRGSVDKTLVVVLSRKAIRGSGVSA